MRPRIVCLRCRHDRTHAGRGLCHACHELLRQRGELDQYPRTKRRWEDIAEDAVFLRDQGIGCREICQRLNLRLYRLRALLAKEGV